MKKTRHVIPFIDIIFQALGALIVVMASLQHVESIPVNFATVAKEVLVSKRIEKPLFVAISGKGVFSGKEKVNEDELKERVKNREVILRVDKDISYGTVVYTVAAIRDRAKNIALEVRKNE